MQVKYSILFGNLYCYLKCIRLPPFWCLTCMQSLSFGVVIMTHGDVIMVFDDVIMAPDDVIVVFDYVTMTLDDVIMVSGDFTMTLDVFMIATNDTILHSKFITILSCVAQPFEKENWSQYILCNISIQEIWLPNCSCQNSGKVLFNVVT